MKKAVFTIIYCFLFFGLNAQNDKKFDIQKTQIGNYLVKSTDEQPKTEGNIGRVVIADQKAVDELIKNAVKEVLNKEEFKSLHSGSGYILYVNPDGMVVNCSFNIDESDINLFTDSDYLTIYNNFKKLIFSVDKLKVSPYPYDSPDSKISYGIMHGSLLME
jgi:hypothetical protein